MILIGLTILRAANPFGLSLMGLGLLGAGLASGFPIMLGFAGDRYPEISGTAFSLVLSIALLGNTLVNFGMGIIAQTYGNQHLITFAFAETIIMMAICLLVLNSIKNKK
jgi:fucose permease